MALNFQNNETSSGRVSLIITLAVSLACLGIYAAEGAQGPLHKVQGLFEGAAAPLQQASGRCDQRQQHGCGGRGYEADGGQRL